MRIVFYRCTLISYVVSDGHYILSSIDCILLWLHSSVSLISIQYLLLALFTIHVASELRQTILQLYHLLRLLHNIRLQRLMILEEHFTLSLLNDHSRWKRCSMRCCCLRELFGLRSLRSCHSVHHLRFIACTIFVVILL